MGKATFSTRSTGKALSGDSGSTNCSAWVPTRESGVSVAIGSVIRPAPQSPEPPAPQRRPKRGRQAPAQELVQVAPTDLVLDANVRLDSRLDKEFLASIRERGVLQPIIAYRDAERLVVLAGKRRTLAAVQVDLYLVPVVVVPAPSVVDRLTDQLVENDHRTDITTGERAAAYEQLALLGLSAAQIARRTATKGPEVVEAGLAVARSERARAAAAEHQLTLEQAAAIAEFEQDPKAMETLVTAARRGGWSHQLQWLRDRRSEAVEQAAAAAELALAGIRVVEQPGYQSAVKRLDLLLGHDGVELTSEAHASCPGHAAYLEARYEYDDDEDDPEDPERTWVPVYVCLDPAGNGHTSRSAAGVLKPTPAERSEEQRERELAERRDVIASNKAWDSAVKVRREWLRRFLARRAAPKGAAAFVASALASCDHRLSQALTEGHTLAHELLGILKPSGYGYRGKNVDEQLLAGASEGRALVATLGLVLAAVEAGTGRQSWRSPDPDVTRYLRWIESQGYELSEVELRACGVKAAAHG